MILFNRIRNHWRWQKENLRLCFNSLFCNHHLDLNYASDVAMEPIFWFVDNFAKFLGPFFVICVVLIMAAVIFISYYIGFPYWWKKNPHFTIILLIVGNWLKVNTIFHYYMGVVTPPGYPPKGAMIQEAVSICRKCIAPKPPRTHHCSVCDRCILKMDHHCPWLNNCVGHYNHRYFFMYMVFISLSTLFIMVFGAEIGYAEVWIQEYEEIYGHPVTLNRSEMIPVPEWDNTTGTELPLDIAPAMSWKRRAILFMAFICSGGFVALTLLVVRHAKQIVRGETSIESHINQLETKRHANSNTTYTNPYDYGTYNNWKFFFGIGNGKSWFHVIFPSAHPPFGNGLTWDSFSYLSTDIRIKKIP